MLSFQRIFKGILPLCLVLSPGVMIVVVAGLDGKTALADGATKEPEKPADRLSAIRKALIRGGRTEADQVASELKELGKLELSQTDRESWVRLARDAAIRQGDKEWLRSLQDVPDSFGLDMIYTVLLASGHLAKAEMKQAKATLDGLKNPEEMNEREKRRVEAIRARIAQLEGDTALERKHVEKLVDHLYLWSKPVCQSCHNSPQDPKVITSMPITNLWFGERYVELLKEQGDAEKVKNAAEVALKNSPSNDKARIRLAFALQALGKKEEAKEEFRKLPWAEFPDRDLKKPRMMTTFP